MATNPNNALGTPGAFGGRTSVNALSDNLAMLSSRGVLQGWTCRPYSGMTVALGGSGNVRDVAVAEDPAGNRVPIDNRTTTNVQVTLEAASNTGDRIDVIVAYVNNPAEITSTGEPVADNPEICGIIAVSGEAATEPTAPDESAIRTAITADGSSGSTAYYVVLATISVPQGTTDVTTELITNPPKAVVTIETDSALDESSNNPVANAVLALVIGNLQDTVDALPQIFYGTEEIAEDDTRGKNGDIYFQYEAAEEEASASSASIDNA